MTSYVTKLIAKKLLGENIQNKFGFEDPYFENVPATRLDGKPGRVRRQRKAIPPGLSEHDAKVLTKVKRRAYRLDCKWSLAGFRFGIGSLIGIIPVIGDGFDVLLACMVVKTACQVEGGLPYNVLVQMFFAIICDFFIGLIPFIGDLGDAVYKANTKNAAYLEAHLRKKGALNLKTKGTPVPAVDPSDPEEFEGFQEEGVANFVPSPDGGRAQPVGAQATPATRPAGTSGGVPAGGGLFGFMRKNKPAADVERGTRA